MCVLGRAGRMGGGGREREIEVRKRRGKERGRDGTRRRGTREGTRESKEEKRWGEGRREEDRNGTVHLMDHHIA